MISFIISLLALIVGYFLYGSFVERLFGASKERKTPAFTHSDGVDYVPMHWSKAFLIQFLNIAGLGPIFGAIMGAMYGTASFLWIVIGTIFAGATHDYVSGMLSVRNAGASLPELVGQQLGSGVKQFLRFFTVLLLILVGAVFISGPAGLLNGLVPTISSMWWIVIVFAYYICATLLPIDKLIGRLYPVFGFALLFMALGILIAMFWNNAPIPEIPEGLSVKHPQHLPIFPMMFVSIACGAISGFHATQSPLMARCITNERLGKRVFYGAMVAEGVVALIWAAAASSFFGGVGGLQNYVASLPKTANAAAEVVNLISHSWLGIIGGALAMIGVIAAPITSGDTALRSARLIVADILHIEQKSLLKRIAISLPLFIVCFVLLQMNFDILWRYFAWSNQTLSVFTLWAVTLWFSRREISSKALRFSYIITLIPAIFMTSVCITYILYAPEGLRLPYMLSVICGCGLSLAFAVWFFWYKHKHPQTIKSLK
ncbi:MAG: carbon starvation protein A [Bacteroidales bacterium]|jgi:carbon starvation protein CstA|nr:carbon starvation protein A [Bacteroidales bacterium]